MSESYILKLKDISTFIFDIDGVLTDGSITIMPDGEQVRKMNIKDGYALQLAIKKGYRIAIISGGSSEAAKKRLNGLGITDIYLRVQDKADKFEDYCIDNEINPANCLYMGDDIPDYEVMQRVHFAACPADAAREIQEIADYHSTIKGGEGCVRDIIEKVMTMRGDWFHPDKKDDFKW